MHPVSFLITVNNFYNSFVLGVKKSPSCFYVTGFLFKANTKIVIIILIERAKEKLTPTAL